ncbi:MAG: hypothetical protein WDN66_00360 [Candidatus Saccharibacteria bacterium]
MVIKVEHLTKKYGKKVAVNDISFKVENGKVTVFLVLTVLVSLRPCVMMLGLANGQGTTLFDNKPLHSYKNPSGVVVSYLKLRPSTLLVQLVTT